MAASISNSINSLECHVCTVAPANEEQCAPGLVLQPVTLGAPRRNEGPAQQEPMQDQGMGEVGQRTSRITACAWWTVFLSGRNALLLVVVYQVVTSMNDLTPVASRVIHWASTWNRPVLSAVVIVCLAWT